MNEYTGARKSIVRCMVILTIMDTPYTPYANRTPDTQYRDLLRSILDNGIRSKSQTGTDTISYMAPNPMRFSLANGFPMITERSIEGFWKTPIGELLGFINGARTTDVLEEFGCKWWNAWATEKKCAKRGLKTGDLGPGSYGAAFHDFPMIDGNTFNQFDFLVRQIKEKPHLKTHVITPFVPQYMYRVEGHQQKVVVVPCHGLIHVRVIDGVLSLVMWQRSGDVPVGVPANMVQYSALALILAHVTGNKPGEYIHMLSDAHIYVDQVPVIEQLFDREPRRFPTVTFDTAKKDLFAFRKDDFELTDYDAHERILGIPVAV